MKKLFHVACLAIVAATVTLLSGCLGDDGSDDSTITVFTKEQRAAAIQTVMGTYTSSLSFTDGTTATSSWNASADSTVVCSPFPMKVLINALSTSASTQSEILKEAGSQKLRGVLHPLYSYGSTIVFSTEYENMEFTVGDGESAHTVTIVMATQVVQSGLTAQSCTYYADSQLQSLLLIEKVTIDGVDYELNSGFTVTGSKL